MYVENFQLHALLSECHVVETVTPAMLDAFLLIAHGYYRRYGYGVTEEEFCQECVVRLLERFRGIRAEGNLFAYLTRLCGYVLLDFVGMKEREKRNLAGYSRMLKESGPDC
jgi:hypothetical protein